MIHQCQIANAAHGRSWFWPCPRRGRWCASLSGLVAAVLGTASGAGAQAVRSPAWLSVEVGPVARDTRVVSTDRVGLGGRVGIAMQANPLVDVQISLTASGFGGGADDLPVPVVLEDVVARPFEGPLARSYREFRAIGADVMGHFRSSAEGRGPYLALGVGTMRLADSEADDWHPSVIAGLGYQWLAGEHQRVFIEADYKHLVSMDGSPGWLLPVVAGMRCDWTVLMVQRRTPPRYGARGRA